MGAGVALHPRTTERIGMRHENAAKGVGIGAAILVLTLGMAGASSAQPPQGGRPAGVGMPPPPPPHGPAGPGGGDGRGFGPGRPGDFGGRMMGPLGGLLTLNPDVPLAGLNLTDAQREQVRTILQGHRAEGRALMDRARVAMDAMQKATDGTAIDEAAAIERGQALGTAIGEAAVLRARVRTEVLAILTPQQQAEAKAMAADRKERQRKGMDRMPPPPRPRPDGVPFD
jgi:Spy/CpxP family protein refolding chaperone